jgi:hypothetical protein
MRLANGSVGEGSTRVSIYGVRGYGNETYGLEVVNSGTRAEVEISDSHFFSNTLHGVAVQSTHREVRITGGRSFANGGSGLYVDGQHVFAVNFSMVGNTSYGYEEASGSQRNVIGSGCDLRGNTAGEVLLGTNNWTFISPDAVDFDIGAGDIIASAETTTLPHTGKVFVVTGTTDITSVTASWRGRVVTLQFDDVLTFTDGSNLLIAGNFVTSANDTITLYCNGTNWFEMSRSAN